MGGDKGEEEGGGGGDNDSKKVNMGSIWLSLEICMFFGCIKSVVSCMPWLAPK